MSDYHIAVATGAMLDDVYSMRYKSYSAEGYIAENSSLKFIDEYDDKPNSTCFLLYHKDQAVGSIRTCVFDPNQRYVVPAMEVFDDEIRNHIGYASTFVEVNKFVIDPPWQRKGGVEACMFFVGTVTKEAIQRGAKNMLIAVRPDHVQFYKLFGYSQISDAKSYPHLAFETILMVCADIQRSLDFLQSKATQ